jgi:hypothetical protein
MDALKSLITTFADTRRHMLDNPWGAYCMCDSTSTAFIRFAREAGYTGRLAMYEFDIHSERNPDPTLYQVGQHPTEGYRRARWHCIVETEEFLLDFTAKQYHHEVGYPYLISRKVANVPVFGEHVSTDDKHAIAIKMALECSEPIQAFKSAAAGGE